MSRTAFISALGIAQIASWGSLYYAFPLLAVPMEAALGSDRVALYLAPTIGLLVASLGAYPVGAAIDRGHGRWVMVGGSLLAALLLWAWSMTDSVAMLYLLFAGIGLAQSMTLYDPAFAVIARRYGADARHGITALTLWGGFASTVFIPLVQLLLDLSDWRTALTVLALINLVLCLPLHYWAIDRRRDAADVDKPAVQASVASRPTHSAGWALRRPVFWCLAASFTLYYGTFSALTYHLYPLLLERGLSAQAVVGAMALIGPAQVAGRLFVWMLARRQPARLVGGVTVAVLPLALALLALAEGPVALVIFALLYGAANGIMTIVRGVAIPEMLTPQAYGAINGMIAVPTTLAKGLAPMAVAALWSAFGAYETVLTVLVAAGIAVACTFWVAAMISSRQEPVEAA